MHSSLLSKPELFLVLLESLLQLYVGLVAIRLTQDVLL